MIYKLIDVDGFIT